MPLVDLQLVEEVVWAFLSSLAILAYSELLAAASFVVETLPFGF